ncbi:hypothetical protein DKX38_012435 [Salix brachista]|uniref:Uncharacterized protein n=1 Tax=Salix brachista TaxID=2182728 RepID=A0A5N5LNM6_9ROSI|nr:hypothetical protein DKX38_012435 [Salix brachista]
MKKDQPNGVKSLSDLKQKFQLDPKVYGTISVQGFYTWNACGFLAFDIKQGYPALLLENPLRGFEAELQLLILFSSNLVELKRTCEICGSVARNVAGAIETELAEPWNQANDIAMATTTVPVQPAETRSFWQGHQFLNFLLACMVFAFVISWLFHFNVPS